MKTELKCTCRKCNPNAWWMVLCYECGNKRCPHATDHRNLCTGSNDPDQKGSVYGGIALVNTETNKES